MPRRSSRRGPGWWQHGSAGRAKAPTTSASGCRGASAESGPLPSKSRRAYNRMARDSRHGIRFSSSCARESLRSSTKSVPILASGGAWCARRPMRVERGAPRGACPTESWDRQEQARSSGGWNHHRSEQHRNSGVAEHVARALRAQPRRRSDMDRVPSAAAPAAASTPSSRASSSTPEENCRRSAERARAVSSRRGPRTAARRGRR